jgi:hemerythrin-like domain-containing protein
MLAARGAWAILESEHAHMRRLLAAMADVLDAGAWRRTGAAQQRLVQIVAALHLFDRATHRPKGAAMMQAMSGRSAPADQHLDHMQRERERDDALLAQATGLLAAIVEGDDGRCGDCLDLLMRYREGLLRQMEQEETLLREHAERLLTQDEWSQVVSAISSTLYASARSVAAGADEGT